MRFSKLLLTTAALALAALPAAGQDAEAPPAPEASDAPRGLSDLEAVVDELLEEETNPTSRLPPRTRLEETIPEPETSEPEPGEVAPVEIPRSEPDASEPDAPEPQREEPAETPAAEPAEAPPAPPAPATPATPTPATPAPPAPPLTRTEIAALERTVTRGQLLIAIARAGLLATQDMLTRVSDPEGAGISGWIAEPQGNAMDVTFFSAGAGESEASAVYRATINGGRIVSREIFLGADRPVLNPIQARMAAARAATDALDHAACTDQPFNVLVVPPTSVSAPVDAYQTSAPARQGAFPLGGHFRATVNADGSVAETRGFTNSCVDVEVPAATAGQPARPIGITHFLDPMPTEIHMFLSQLIGRPLLVATGDPQRIWLVTGDRIAEVRQ